MPWRRATRRDGVLYPGALLFGEGHRVSEPELPSDLQEIVYEWFGDPPDETYYAIWVWHAPTPRQLRIKGGPKHPFGPEVRHGNPKTLTRWKHNRRMQMVASTQYPKLSPEDAVEAWWRHGGSMQPLRWSDAQVGALREDIGTQLVGDLDGVRAQPGQGILLVGGTSPEVRSPATKRRENAQKREHYAAKRRAAGLPYRPRSRQ